MAETTKKRKRSISAVDGNEAVSDFSITCQGRTWQVQRAVVCEQSAFFRKACENGFRETETKIVDLPADDPEAVERMLDFLYSGDYSDGWTVPLMLELLYHGRYSTTATVAPLMLNLLVLEIGDKYLIDPLVACALEKFQRSVRMSWATPAFGDAIVRVFSDDFAVRESEWLEHFLLQVTKQNSSSLLGLSGQNDEISTTFQSKILDAPRFLLALARLGFSERS